MHVLLYTLRDPVRQCGRYFRAGQGTYEIWRMCIVCWTTKATNARSEYVILITFFTQKFLQGHTLSLHYTYISYPVIVTFQETKLNASVNLFKKLKLTTISLQQ
jgi:hypothetical protein